MNPRFKVLLPLVISFIILAAAIFLAGILFPGSGINYIVLMAANCLFFLVSLVAFRIQRKAMDNANPNAFIRSVMAGVMVKMFVCIVAVMAYLLLIG